MPELPDITVYVESLEARVKGQVLENVRIGNPFILRTVAPPLHAAAGKTVRAIERIGKRIVLALDEELFVVIHLMVAGRLHWKKPHVKLSGRVAHAAFDFASGSLLLTEASTKKRAAIHFVKGRSALTSFDRGGLEPLDSSAKSFNDALKKGEQDSQACADRPQDLQRNWQRIFGRNSPSVEVIPSRTDT